MANRFVYIEDALPSGTRDFAITVDFTEIRGLAFGFTAAYAKVREPEVLATDGWYLASFPRESLAQAIVRTVITFPRADRFSWNERPSSGDDKSDFAPATTDPASIAPPKTEDIVSWDYDLAKGNGLPPPPVFGTDQSVIDHDSDESFRQGIAFGVAGSALIVALQVTVQVFARIGVFGRLWKSARKRRYSG
ncbi:hypothetical protein A5626_01745 [Mycobacterium marseillense]|uniref:hypothetical protein n=1 Tax=Mycobacterium marseillense TaxID=701042 RepID=UPI00080093E7|nr:hypothetical protein [Mycobacterium marseillense]MCA2265192.1 hypothetical protein [Mycobacterium marseillense]OBJ75032.1 hypothetical protein A5626_01745 [Mycobacterium marseillense]